NSHYNYISISKHTLHNRLQTSSTLFPYTTLFRSDPLRPMAVIPVERKPLTFAERTYIPQIVGGLKTTLRHLFRKPITLEYPEVRSEEHTSELQSRENLVCRLLLEKKKLVEIITY